jgi:hypothetical protein
MAKVTQMIDSCLLNYRQRFASMGRNRASELRCIGKIEVFRENRLEARQIKVFSYACCYERF